MDSPTGAESFWKDVAPRMEPVMLEGCDFGPASTRWADRHVYDLSMCFVSLVRLSTDPVQRC